MSLNKEKAFQEYLEYLYGDVIDDEIYAIDILQSKSDFLAGYKAAEPRWYNTKDKLPEEDMTVLCYLEDIDNLEWYERKLGVYLNEKWYCRGGRKTHEIVTRWMEIPE